MAEFIPVGPSADMPPPPYDPPAAGYKQPFLTLTRVRSILQIGAVLTLAYSCACWTTFFAPNVRYLVGGWRFFTALLLGLFGTVGIPVSVMGIAGVHYSAPDLLGLFHHLLQFRLFIVAVVFALDVVALQTCEYYANEVQAKLHPNHVMQTAAADKMCSFDRIWVYCRVVADVMIGVGFLSLQSWFLRTSHMHAFNPLFLDEAGLVARMQADSHKAAVYTKARGAEIAESAAEALKAAEGRGEAALHGAADRARAVATAARKQASQYGATGVAGRV